MEGELQVLEDVEEEGDADEGGGEEGEGMVGGVGVVGLW